MCQPASFIVTKKQVFWSMNSESHTDIIEEYNLKEQDTRGNYTFVKVEIVPPNNDYKLPFSKWKFQLDQDFKPEWYDQKDVEKRCRAKLKEWRKAKVVMPNENRKEIKNGEVVAIYGTVESVSGNGTVKYVSGNGTVKYVYGNGTVESVSGNGTVEYVYGNGTVKSVSGNGMVKSVSGNGTVKSVKQSAIVISYNSLNPNILKSSKALLIDRAKDPVVCYVGKNK